MGWDFFSLPVPPPWKSTALNLLSPVCCSPRLPMLLPALVHLSSIADLAQEIFLPLSLGWRVSCCPSTSGAFVACALCVSETFYPLFVNIKLSLHGREYAGTLYMPLYCSPYQILHHQWAYSIFSSVADLLLSIYGGGPREGFCK